MQEAETKQINLEEKDPEERNNENLQKYDTMLGVAPQKRRKTMRKSFLQNEQELNQQKEDINNKQQEEPIKKNLIYYLDICLDHIITTVVMTVITLYALFGDDVRILVTDKQGDPVFWILNIVTMVAFTIEIIVSSIVKKNYWLGFFFWLDIISTLSLILDIGWISQEIFSEGSLNGAANAAALARAGRASRVGTKAGRIIRIVRLIRLVKLYKHAQQAIELENDEQDMIDQDFRQNTINTNGGQSVLKKQKVNLDNGSVQGNNIPVTKGKNDKIQQIEDNNQLNHPTNEHLNSYNDVPIQKIKVILPPVQQRKIKIQKKVIKNTFDSDAQPQVLNNSQKDPFQNIQTVKAHNYEDQIQVTEENQDFNELIPSRQIYQEKQIKSQNFKSQQQPQVSQNHQINQKPQEINQKEQQQDENNKKNDTLPLPQETKVGEKLSDLTTKRVITLVLSIMFSIPLFSTSTYVEPTVSYNQGLWNIIVFNQQEELMQKSMQQYIEYHKNLRSPVIYMSITNVNYECCQYYPNEIFNDNVKNYEDLRTDDLLYYDIEDSKHDIVAISIVDNSTNSSLNAILSMLRTLFISLILSGGAMLFSKDVQDLVLNPIQNMLDKVQQIAKNPLEAAQIEEQQALAWEQLKQKGITSELDKKKEEEKLETIILEKLIIKIGALLALGFGEAGSEIIAENMSKGGAVDPLIPGKKMMAIFGFCDIRNFTDATEVLQQGVMVFVNEIAEITHSLVYSYCGQANKNIGDAFLLVWKYSEEFVNKDLSKNQMTLKNNKTVSELSDLPVIAFLKIMSALQMSQNLHKYREEPGLLERMPGYIVKMGYGLHVGWAIEGAIGSNFKIDASYLSPNVNMASRLEAATKQFGTMLLISGDLYTILTSQMKQQCRLIDRVTVKGSIQPMDLYTIDVSLENLEQKYMGPDQFQNTYESKGQIKKRRVLQRIKRNKLKSEIIEGKTHVSDLFKTDRELFYMREVYTISFYQKFAQGFKNYIDGNWQEAQKYLNETYKFIPGHKDGPSKTLLDYMKDFNFEAPDTWQNYRELTDK